jgi:hypothetical protein
VTYPPAPHTRPEQFAFLRDAHAGPLVWHRECLSLARQAPGLPGGIPSAHAAAVMTPAAHRIHDAAKITRGMFVYFANFHDDNPDDHVVTAAGWDSGHVTGQLHDLLTWSNDIVRTGGVDLVRADRFPDDWAAPFWFASISHAGFMLPGFTDPRGGAEPDPEHSLDVAISALRKSLRWHRAHHHPRRVAAISRDLAELKQTRRDHPNT